MRLGLELAWRLQTLAWPECSSTSMPLSQSGLTALRNGLVDTRVGFDRLIPDLPTK